MNADSNNVENMAIVEVSPQTTNNMVDTHMADETDDIKRETKALLDAIRIRAQAEAQSAGTLTRETYLNAVRKAREAIEGEQLIERRRIENAFDVLQNEAEKNWENLVKQLAELGDRTAAAAQAAWNAFNDPRHS